MIGTGSRLGPYEILGPLGAGGMGEVYRARDTRLGREVALKILPERFARDREALARFRREACSASALNHPHIVTIHDVGSERRDDGSEIHYFTMELIDGGTLRERIARDPLKKLLGYITQVADGLAKAHAAGILHRDLKPENIMVAGDGYAKVVDFGLAKSERDRTQEIDSDAPTQLPETSPGTVVGTASYMSPEQVEGRELDARSDIFSLGCILYEVATGKRPFDARSKVDTMHAIMHTEPGRIAESNPTAPSDLQRIVDRCLAKDRDDRYQSVKEVGIELRALLRQLDSSGSVQQQIRRPRWRPWAIAAIVVAVLTTVIATAVHFARAPQAEVRSLAILPFVNGSKDAAADYLSDGITDEIINSLSQIPGLRVLARSTVFRFKGRDMDPRSLGRELGVDAIVLGELRELQDLVNVKVELVRTTDGAQIWGGQYNRRMSDVLSIQQDVARDVSDHLRLHLSGQDARRMARSHTQNPQAYQAYLKGLYYWNQRPGGSERALREFEEAARLDPADPLAHAGVANAYDTMGAWEVGQLAPKFAFPRAKAAAQRALSLDPDLAEAYAALGFEELHYERDFNAAESNFQKAISLRPTYSTAHHWYSHLLIARGRFDESLRESQKALELEPLDGVLEGHLSFHYVYSRQPELALEQCRKTMELFPNSFWAFYFRGLALEEKGQQDEAITAFRRAHELVPMATFPSASLGHALAVAGQRAEALSILHELENDKSRYISPYDRAIVHIGLGERDGAFRELDRAVQETSSWVVYFQHDPRLDPLRGEPRFAELVKRAGL